MEELRKIIIDEVEQRKELEKEIQQIKFSLDDIAHEKKRIEDKIFFEVSSEKDENGKAVFSNDTLRKSETSNRVSRNPEYAELLVKEYQMKKKLSDNEIELDYLRRRFKSVEYIIELMKLGKWGDD